MLKRIKTICSHPMQYTSTPLLHFDVYVSWQHSTFLPPSSTCITIPLRYLHIEVKQGFWGGICQTLANSFQPVFWHAYLYFN